MAWLRVLVFIIAIVGLPEIASATIGTVVSVKQGAELTRDGKSSRLLTGTKILSGDTITTSSTGVVQLVFTDDTKIAVGSNASMTLDVTMLRNKRRAKSFGVQALGGSFRFISGNSRKRAYSVTTPTATMAVRGTTFDMWVTKGNQSAMLILEGTVLMCGKGGSCRSARRQCSMFATNSGGGVGRPSDQEQYAKALKAGFPFQQSQQQLLPSFQVNAEGCAREAAVVRPIEPGRPEPRQQAKTETVTSPPEKPVEKPEPDLRDRPNPEKKPNPDPERRPEPESRPGPKED